MIAYHGTPVGGTRQDAARFLKGRHALVSYANPQDMAIVADACASFVLDNGAFTMWRGGKTPDWNDYLKWVGEWSKHPGFGRYALTDGIKIVEGKAIHWNATTRCLDTGRMYLVIGTDAHPTEAAAKAAAESMRAKKIASLQKQIARLEKLTF